MARNKKSAKSKMEERADVIQTKRPEVYTAEYAGYLVVDILEKHEKELEKFKPTFEEVFSFLEEAIDSGLKLVTTYSKDGASVRAELHDMDKTSDFAGWRLSSFGGNVWEALVILYYKETVILGNDWDLASRTRNKRTYG